MKRLSAIAAILVSTLILEPMSAIGQDASQNPQLNSQQENDAGNELETGSVTSTQELESETVEEPVQQPVPQDTTPQNLALDGQFSLWLNNLNAISGANARTGTVRLRRISNQLFVSNLVIDDPAFDLSIEIGSATFSNASEPFGTYVVGADKVVLENFRIKLGETEFEAANIVLTNVLLPEIQLSSNAQGSTSSTRFERKRALVTELVRLVAGAVSIPILTVRIYSDKDETEVLAESLYLNNQVSSLKGSKIGRLSIAASETLSPPLEPLIEESFGKVELTNFSFETVMKLFDGNGTASTDDTFFDAFSLNDYSLSIGGLDLDIDTLQMADVSIADIADKTEDQLLQIIESKKDLDAISSKDLPAFALEFVSLPKFGAFAIKGLKVGALGIQDLGFDNLSFNDMSLAGIAVAQFSGFNAVLDDIGTVRLKSASLSGLKLPGKSVLIDVANGEKRPISDLLPILNSLSVSGLSAEMPELGLEGSLEDLSVATTLNQAGVITGLGMSLSELKLPGALIPRDGTMLGRLGGIMDSIGLETLQLNQIISMNFDENNRKLSISDFTASIAKLGGLSMTATIDNIASSPFENPTTTVSEIRKGSLSEANIIFKNEGVVEAGFDAQAKKLGTKGDTLRGQVGATLPFLVAVLQNQPFQQQLVKSLQAFLPNPESLTVRFQPENGVAIADIERQLRGDPRKLIGLLETTIENSPTSKPTETETPAN